jgi:hypothetical protein
MGLTSAIEAFETVKAEIGTDNSNGP